MREIIETRKRPPIARTKTTIPITHLVVLDISRCSLFGFREAEAPSVPGSHKLLICLRLYEYAV
jgi:hypothetical protein